MSSLQPPGPSIRALRKGILAGREALAVCRARGVDVDAFEDAKSFMAPAWLGAVAVWVMMKTNGPARKILNATPLWMSFR